MNNSDTLLKAAINRITARLGEKIIETAAELAVKAQDAPEQLKKEWELLKEEIYQEAERLEDESNPKKEKNSDFEQSTNSKPITKIDQIRGKVSKLNKKIEDMKSSPSI